MAAPALYDVQVRLEAADAPADAAELVTKALGAKPLEGVTGRAAVSTTDQGVTVRFDGVAAPEESEGNDADRLRGSANEGKVAVDAEQIEIGVDIMLG